MRAPYTPPPPSTPQVVGFFHGYAAQRFELTFYWWLAASLAAGALSIPSWRCLFRRQGIVWADELADEEGEEEAPPSGGGKKKKKAA